MLRMAYCSRSPGFDGAFVFLEKKVNFYLAFMNFISILVRMASPPPPRVTTVLQICDKNIAFSFSLAFIFSL